VPNHQFMKAYKNGNWDGYHYFYNGLTRRFLSGFLPFIISNLMTKKIKCELVDQRDISLHTLVDFAEDLRWYQKEAIAQLTLSYVASNAQSIFWPRGVLKAPTGSGKTPMAARLIQALNVPTLYIVETLDNMYQTAEVFEKWTDKRIGIVGDSSFCIAEVTIGSLRTLVSKEKQLQPFFKSVQCVIVDECHQVSQNQYHKVLTQCINAPYRYGISGTPLFRSDLGDCYLIGDCGEIIYEVERSKLEEEGYLSKVKVYFYPIKTPVDKDAHFQTAYSELICHNEHRNKSVVTLTEMLISKGRTVLVLARMVEHGQLLRDMIRAKGIPCAFVSGKDPADIRKAALDAIGEEAKVVVASTIFDQSIDCPELDDLIIASGGNSTIKSIQRPGRVSRPKTSGKNIAYVIDFLDQTNRHLLNHSLSRKAVYEREGFEVKVIK
jgi:superfamily II DNA or RNA helicase